MSLEVEAQLALPVTALLPVQETLDRGLCVQHYRVLAGETHADRFSSTAKSVQSTQHLQLPC